MHPLDMHAQRSRIPLLLYMMPLRSYTDSSAVLTFCNNTRTHTQAVFNCVCVCVIVCVRVCERVIVCVCVYVCV